MPALEPDILNFKTLLQNITSISGISLNFRTIYPVVTEILIRQNIGKKKEEWQKNRQKKEDETEKNKSPTSFERLNEIVKAYNYQSKC